MNRPVTLRNLLQKNRHFLKVVSGLSYSQENKVVFSKIQLP